MKALFCQECGDIVAPFRAARKPRYCVCGRHAVWWENPATGVLRVHDAWSPFKAGDPHHGWPGKAAAYVLGFTNLWLSAPDGLTAEDYQAIPAAHDDHYLFKRLGTVAIRIRPGESGDTRWAPLPQTHPEER